MTLQSTQISLSALLSRFRRKVSFTLFLVLADSVLGLLFPLFIGFAINGLIEDSFDGILALGGLGLLSLLVGSGRRYYDTRAYADIYVTISEEMVTREQERESSVSKTAGRASLVTEFVEFLENSMPVIVTSVIGVFGVLVIIANLNWQVFWACIALFVLMVVIYLVSGKKNLVYNEEYNNEIERRVDVLSSQAPKAIRKHFKSVMHWNIRLSDLETLNYAVLWLGIIALLVYAPVVVVDSGVANYGLVFSILMYVFQYIESLATLPLFIQQMIRLQEISTRLEDTAATAK